MATRIEKYLAHLDDLTAGEEPTVSPIEPPSSGPRKTFAIVYREFPEPGYTTGFTYGLSTQDRPEWKTSKPELCITVNSSKIEWATAVAFLADRAGSHQLFEWGTAMGFGGPIADDSAMDAFLVFKPLMLDEDDDAARVDVDEERPIMISGCYPIYDSEARFIGKGNLAEFLDRDWDPYDVKRPPFKRRRSWRR